MTREPIPETPPTRGNKGVSRRELLYTMGLAGVAVLTTGCAPESAENTSNGSEFDRSKPISVDYKSFERWDDLYDMENTPNDYADSNAGRTKRSVAEAFLRANNVAAPIDSKDGTELSPNPPHKSLWNDVGECALVKITQINTALCVAATKKPEDLYVANCLIEALTAPDNPEKEATARSNLQRLARELNNGSVALDQALIPTKATNSMEWTPTSYAGGGPKHDVSIFSFATYNEKPPTKNSTRTQRTVVLTNNASRTGFIRVTNYTISKH